MTPVEREAREPRTVGEKVERDGIMAAMLACTEIAEALGRIPAGEWDYRFQSEPTWRICLNGGKSEHWQPPNAPKIPQFHVYIERSGWPLALFNAADGTFMFSAENDFMQAADKELRVLRGAIPPSPQEKIT